MTACNATEWDIVAWPSTAAGTEAVVACPSTHDHIESLNITSADELDGLSLIMPEILSTPLANATRLCMENGSWHPIADFTRCAAILNISATALDNQLVLQIAVFDEVVMIGTLVGYIYLAGAILSSISVITALAVFCAFRRLHCLRNYIHMQLMASSLMKLVLWFILYGITFNRDEMYNTSFCHCIGVLLVYSSLCQFTWMFFEALNIVMLVVRAMVPKSVQLKLWLLIGWGVPILVAIVWGVFNAYNSSYQPGGCWTLHYARTKAYSGNLIIAIPMYLLTSANLVLLGFIIHILISKHRYKPLTSSARRTIKATFVLVPLLGVNHILWVYPPEVVSALLSRILVYANAALQSTQGFWVALFYCFLNAEVKNTLSAKTRNLRENLMLPSYIFGKRKCVSISSEFSPNNVPRTVGSDLIFISSQPSEGSSAAG